jgi:exodeoxyribonuclease-5
MWSPQQERALSVVDKWFKEESKTKKIFRLFGYAGTGKTTLAKHFAENINGKVLYGAFTGKAAHVLTQKGCTARTIHSLIYRPLQRSQKDIRELKEKIDETLDAVEKEKLELKLKELSKKHGRPLFELVEDSEVRDAALIIIDECSMVGKQMGQDLCSFGVPILVLGDPGQLPPIGDAGFFTAQTPDILLTEVHRQAQDNPILKLATFARNSEEIPCGDYGGGVVVKRKNQVTADEIMAADQVLIGKNETRRTWNNRIRQIKYNKDYVDPQLGDKVICLKNNNKSGLMNGSLWELSDYVNVQSDTVFTVINSLDQDYNCMQVKMYVDIFRGKEIDFFNRMEGVEDFDYGYAVTVHKSQGSQWDKVILLDESHSFRSTKDKWLYTGITRAAKELTILV